MPADRSLPWSRIELPVSSFHGHTARAAYECQVGMAVGGITPVTVFLICNYMGHDFEFSAVVKVAGEPGMGLLMAFAEAKGCLEFQACRKIDELFDSAGEA